MYGCSETQKLIDPSLDRELEIQESLHVQTHLKDCAACRERLLDEQEFLALLPSLLAPSPAPETLRLGVRDALSREAQRLEQNKRRWRALLSPSMLASVAIMIVFLLAIPRPQIPPLIKIALAEHRHYMRDPGLLEIKSSDVNAVTRSLDARLPFPVHIPPSTAANVHLVGADIRREPTPSAVLAYRVNDSPVSLLVTAPREIALSNAEARTFKNTLFHSTWLEGLHVLQWSDNRHTYVLVACRDISIASLPFAVNTANKS
jgi:anti-sigma factor RsiW